MGVLFLSNDGKTISCDVTHSVWFEVCRVMYSFYKPTKHSSTGKVTERGIVVVV